MEPIAGDIEFQTLDCFACMANTPANEARRAGCVARGHHRPIGDRVNHNHAPAAALFECGDCHTLVVKVAHGG